MMNARQSKWMGNATKLWMDGRLALQGSHKGHKRV